MAGEHDASLLSPLVVQLPNLTVGGSVYVSCCSSFTPGGGCAGATDGIGEVYASCSSDQEYTASGMCEAPDDIGMSLSALPAAAEVDNSTGNVSAAGLDVAYQGLLTAVGQHVVEATEESFALPRAGLLGLLHMRRGTKWRPVVTATASWKHHEGTINTHMHEAAAGSRAVALGNVACRQMGFGGAAFVSNCRGLRLLRKHTTRGGSVALNQVYRLLGCASDGSEGGDSESKKSKPAWKPWIAVQSSTDVSALATKHGSWLAGRNHTFHGPPPWAVHHGWTESFCVGNEAPVAPVGVASGPCEISIDTTTGVMTPQLGICARSAGAVAHCYRDQLTRYRNGLSSTLADREQQLVVACTGTGNEIGKKLDQSGAKGGGTWLVGDGLPGTSYEHNDLAAPKIFANTMPHLISQWPIDSKWFDPNHNVTSWGELDAAAVRSAGYYEGAFANSIDLGKGAFSWSDEDMY